MTPQRNLSPMERWASGIAASLLIGASFKRGGLLGLVGIGTAAGLILRAGTGRCALKAAAQKGGMPSTTEHKATAATPHDDIEMPQERKDLTGVPGPLPGAPPAPFRSV